MGTLRFFYTDYCEDKSIPSPEALEVSKEEVLHSMDCVLHMPGNFLGIIDGNDATLQFMVNDDRSIHIDIPTPTKRGSYVKTGSLGECLELVRTMGETIQHDAITGFRFEGW